MLATLSRVWNNWHPEKRGLCNAFVVPCFCEPIDEVGLFNRAAAVSSRLTCGCVLHLNPGQNKTMVVSVFVSSDSQLATFLPLLFWGAESLFSHRRSQSYTPENAFLGVNQTGRRASRETEHRGAFWAPDLTA